ncbi:serine/threonine-protein kinase [Chloroflexota bacterium]
MEVGLTVAEADMDIGLLPQLENYAIERRLGSGGFADVYLGRDNEGQPVALKIPRLSQHETIETKDFLNEADLWSKLRKLKEPYIVELYEYGTAPYPWIAMEYMDGGSLRGRIDRLECKACLDIVIKLMDALNTAHHHGVIHRDIKPENVLFDSNDNPKLSDWGMGKVLLDASKSSVGFRGTLAYAAPEQLASSRFGSADWRTDIYQMGMLLYDMLAGQLPYAGSEPATMIPSILRIAPPAPSQANDQIPAEVDAAVLRAVAKRKNDRFQSMDAFADSLKEASKAF